MARWIRGARGVRGSAARTCEVCSTRLPKAECVGSRGSRKPDRGQWASRPRAREEPTVGYGQRASRMLVS